MSSVQHILPRFSWRCHLNPIGGRKPQANQPAWSLVRRPWEAAHLDCVRPPTVRRLHARRMDHRAPLSPQGSRCLDRDPLSRSRYA